MKLLKKTLNKVLKCLFVFFCSLVFKKRTLKIQHISEILVFSSFFLHFYAKKYLVFSSKFFIFYQLRNFISLIF